MEKIPIAQLIIDSRIYLVPDLISSIFYNNFNLDDIFLKEKKKNVQIHMHFQQAFRFMTQNS